MPTKKSMMTMESRKNYDQVSFLAPKGTKELLRVLALREGERVTGSDLLRRLILDAAGLRVMPSSDELAELAAAKTREDADAAILRLQEKQEYKPNDAVEAWEEQHSGESNYMRMNPDEWEGFLWIADAIDDELKKQNQIIKKQGVDAPGLGDIRVWMAAPAVMLLKRVVSNILRFDDTNG